MQGIPPRMTVCCYCGLDGCLGATVVNISFVLPKFYVHPIGGYKIVYEYANLLAKKATVSIIFPRPACYNGRADGFANWVKARLWSFKIKVKNRRVISWFALERNVRLVLVPDFDPSFMPDADAIFATAWSTAKPVLQLPASKGEKFYFVQSYEIWDGPKEDVDATWRMPLHIVVISKYLLSWAGNSASNN